jgi:hypothetical protein
MNILQPIVPLGHLAPNYHAASSPSHPGRVKNLALTALFGLLSLIVPSFALAQWSSDPMVNLGVAVKPSDQVQPKIRPAPGGGCYISWFDNDPNGNPPFGYDVFLQKLDASGVAQFAEGGIQLADLGMSSTQDYGLDVDLNGNAVLAFLDDRRPGATEVTAVKVRPTGEQLWGRFGRQVAFGPSFKGNPKVTVASDESVVVGWIDDNNIVLQRLTRSGQPQWGENGVTIVAPNGLTYSIADLHASREGTVIVSFVSSAGFTGPKHLLANKLDSSGALLWGPDHVVVFDGGSLQFGNFPPFVSDGDGGAVFAWYEVDPLQSRAQHILADGTEAFPHNGVPGSTDTSHFHVNPSVSYDTITGETYLFWNEQVPPPSFDQGVSAQKFDPAGVPQWGPTGVVVAPFTTAAILNVTSLFSPTGALVLWNSELAFAQDTISGAKLDASGAFVCSPFPVSSILSSKSRLDLTLSPVTGFAFAAWSDGRSDTGDIYAQDIKPDCTLGQ